MCPECDERVMFELPTDAEAGRGPRIALFRSPAGSRLRTPDLASARSLSGVEGAVRNLEEIFARASA